MGTTNNRSASNHSGGKTSKSPSQKVKGTHTLQLKKEL